MASFAPAKSECDSPMKPIDRRTFLKAVPAVAAVGSVHAQAPAAPKPGEAGPATPKPGEGGPFGRDYPQLDAQTTGRWWEAASSKVPPIINLNVSRDQVVAFALYTH